MDNSFRGIWFYGLSGSGKTFASTIVRDTVDLPFIIDGDAVRNLISTDLGYTISDRNIQLQRILGISIMSIQNGYFPIASSVTMSPNILAFCIDNSIDVLEIQRPYDQLLLHRNIYLDNNHVVGKDIDQTELKTVKMFNDGSKHFIQAVLEYVGKK